MNTQRTKVAVAIAAGFGVILLTTVLVAIPWSSSPMTSLILPIRFVGYTNDTHGTRLASFTVSNVHARQIEYSVSVQLKEGDVWQPERHTPPNIRVSPAQGSKFTVVNPIGGTWRVSLVYWKTPTRRDEFGLGVRRFFDGLKMRGIAKRIPTEKFRGYTLYGPEMTN